MELIIVQESSMWPSVCTEFQGLLSIFSKSFLKVAASESAVAEVLWLLEVTIVYFLRQESNLQFPALQQRYRLFSSLFLYLSLVNLPLLASLKERSIYREFDYFLEVGDENGLEEDDLADKATGMYFPCFERLWHYQQQKLFPIFGSKT